MTPTHTEFDPGFLTFDTEQERLDHDGDALRLRFVDVEGRTIDHTYRGVIGLRCGAFEHDVESGRIRDDVSYEVEGSPWLARECGLRGDDPTRYRHLVLGFNAWMSVEILVRRES